MIDFELDKAHRILSIHPVAALDKQDFVDLAKTVDLEIEAGGDLAGLIIDVPHFPGWDSFGAGMAHLRFVHDHHEHVKQIAVITDSHLGDVAEHLVSHFISAKIRQFPGGQTEQARRWIIDQDSVTA